MCARLFLRALVMIALHHARSLAQQSREFASRERVGAFIVDV
jgi:hypothetical protein